MLRNVLLNKRKSSIRKKILYSREDISFLDESDGDEMDVREFLFIIQETHNDDQKNFETDEINSREESDEEIEETNIESLKGGKDFKESEQEDDENLEKLKHVEKENSKLGNKNIELKSKLSS
jgi:hypothetical protein